MPQGFTRHQITMELEPLYQVVHWIGVIQRRVAMLVEGRLALACATQWAGADPYQRHSATLAGPWAVREFTATCPT
jgi:hypothetical protein